MDTLKNNVDTDKTPQKCETVCMRQNNQEETYIHHMHVDKEFYPVIPKNIRSYLVYFDLSLMGNYVHHERVLSKWPKSMMIFAQKNKRV